MVEFKEEALPSNDNLLPTNEFVPNSLRFATELFTTVSSVPTHIPKSVQEQFIFYVSGSTFRFYWYDLTNNTWQYVDQTPTIDHGALNGLGDDDHTQYILTAGTRAFAGEQSMGTNKLTNVVDPTADQDAATKKYVDDNDTAGSTLLEAIYTDVDITATDTETDLVNVTIPANTLGTTNAVRIKAYFDIVKGRGVETFQFFGYLGASSTNIASGAALTTPSMRGVVEVIVMAAGATNAQDLSITSILGEPSYQTTISPTWFDFAAVTPSRDSTAGLAFKLTGKWSAVGNNDNAIVMRMATVELLKV